MKDKFYQCENEKEAENIERFISTEDVPDKDFPFSKKIYESIMHYKNSAGLKDSVGYVAYKGRKTIYYPHILNKKDERLNFLDEVRPHFDSFKTLHKGFSHLDSSQALAMNFFGLLLLHEELYEPFSKAIVSLINNEKINVPSDIRFCPSNKRMLDFFEQKKCDESEIDVELPFKRNDGTLFTIFIEVKYSEKEIGQMNIRGKRASLEYQKSMHDHIDKYNRIYLPAFQLSGRLVDWNNKTKEQETFTKHYQFFRNILLTKNNNNSISLFLTPKEFNPSIDLSVKNSIEGFYALVPPDLQSQFHFAHICWEDLLGKLKNEAVLRPIGQKYFYPLFS